MIAKLFSRSPLHEHAEPAQRVLGIAELSPDSAELAQLLRTDPAAEVRAAAAARCADLAALATAWREETHEPVRDALADALAGALARNPDAASVEALLETDQLADAIRCEVARRALDADRRRLAIAAVRKEEVLVELALTAEHAETRLAAAERVSSSEGLHKLADAAKTKDRGVAKLARNRIDNIENRQGQAERGDAILAQLAALADKPGPILSELIELDRRWQALDMEHDPARAAQWEEARQRVHARLEREQDAQRRRARFERDASSWTAGLVRPAEANALGPIKDQLDTLRAEAQEWGDEALRARLEGVAGRMAQWARELDALTAAEALVAEAERSAVAQSASPPPAAEQPAGKPGESEQAASEASLQQRWRSLDPAARTPALTRRLEAALQVIEQHKLALDQAAHQHVSAARQQLHSLLHSAEQALAGGQLQRARAAADEIKPIRSTAGLLPKPTLQRMGRLLQQLAELERWESFGQQGARVRLCERAEALAAQTLDPVRLAPEVQALRNEWKTLDRQHAGVPKGLWERFDAACRKAYAPAAKHFAQLATQRKQARKQREEFIDAAAAHAPGLLNEPLDWRAIERWLRETDRAWREGGLGSVEPAAWKELDARLKGVLGPLREALSTAREQARSGRQALIAEATALAAKASERDTPSQLKAIQLRWQQHAKALPLVQRDEQPLWEQFRAACDAIFNARQSRRKEEDQRKEEHRAAFGELCARLEQLATAGDKAEQEIRRAAREIQEQWKKLAGPHDQGPLEARFRSARAAVDTALSARERAREAALWDTLAQKERLCDALDRRACANAEGDAPAAATVPADEGWSALPALPDPWERAMAARRDAALHALADAQARDAHAVRVERARPARRARLLELEILLGIGTPPEFQSERLALQVQQLRQRFSGAPAASSSAAPGRPASRGATGGAAGELLLAWCAEPGISEEGDRHRAERVFTKMAQAR